MKLIGIVGRRRSGKDTAALALLDQGWTLIKFADPLKAMVRTLLVKAGVQIGSLDAFIEGDQKETPLGFLAGKTTRFAMQTLGTEWGRQIIGEDLWIKIAINRATSLPSAVISDVRFANEAAAVKRVGGTLIKIIRDSERVDSVDLHTSETETDSIESDHIISNNSTITDLQEQIRAIAKNL